jgi:hypothetical protein
MDNFALPLIRPCSCGTPLALLHGVWDPDTRQVEYLLALEGDVAQIIRWAQAAVETVYASSAAAAAAYRGEGLLPDHDVLRLDGQVAVAGPHPPGPRPIPGRTTAPQRVDEQVMAEALRQDNYGDFHRVLAEAGLLSPLRPAPPATG